MELGVGQGVGVVVYDGKDAIVGEVEVAGVRQVKRLNLGELWIVWVPSWGAEKGGNYTLMRPVGTWTMRVLLKVAQTLAISSQNA